MADKKTLTFALMDAPFESARSTTALRLIDIAARRGYDINVFAYEGASREVVMDEMTTSNGLDIADLVCILGRGVLVSRGLLLQSESDSPLMWINGGTAALGILYYYLASYASGIIARSLDVGAYMRPFDAWSDE